MRLRKTGFFRASLEPLDAGLIPVDDEAVELPGDLNVGPLAARQIERRAPRLARRGEPEPLLPDERIENRLELRQRQRVARIVDELARFAPTRGAAQAGGVGTHGVRRVEIGYRRGRRVSLAGCVGHHENTFRMAPYSLTGLDFYNYSASMDAELSALEDRIRQAVELCQRLRGENTDLRQRLAKLESDNKRLAEKINGAKDRLEGLLRQIPE